MKIRSKLLLVFLGISLVPLIIQSFFSIYSAQIRMEETIGDSFFKLTESKAFSIATLIESRVKQTEGLVLTPLIINTVLESNLSYLNTADHEVLEKINLLDQEWIGSAGETAIADQINNNTLSVFLRKYQDKSPERFGEIFVTDTKGAVIGMTKTLTDYYQGDEEWWKKSFDIGRGKVFIDNRGYDKSVGALVFGITVPIKSRGAVIGILKINYLMHEILTLITGRNMGRTAEIFLADSLGRFIPSGGTTKRDKLSERELSVLRNMEYGWSEDFHNHRETIMAYHPIDIDIFTRIIGAGSQAGIADEKWLKSNWVIFLEIEKHEAFAPIRKAREILLSLGLIVLIVVSIFARFFAKQVSTPIEVLTRGMGKIGKGNLGQRVGITTKDEIGELANSFNEMSAQLLEITVSRDALDKEITLREQTEEALQDSEERLNAIFEHSSDAIVLVDPTNGRLVIFNRQACKVLGYTREDFKGLHLSDIELKPSHGNLTKHNGSALTDGSHTFQTRCRNKEGGTLYFMVTVSPIDIKGKPYTLNVMSDITESREAAEFHRLSTAVFNHATEGIVITDAAANILTVNPAFSEITGYSAGEAVGENPRILQSGRHDKAFYKQMWHSINTSGHWDGEIWNKRKSGEIYLEWISINAVKDKEGTTVQFTGFFRDFTQRKKLEDHLLQTQKVASIGQIAGGVAHEFNNLLTPIIGYIDIIIKQTSKLPKVQKSLFTVQKAGRRAAALTRDLLAYSRKTPLNLQSQSLQDIAEEVLALLRQTMDRRIMITLESVDDLWPVFMDAGQIHQVIMNLCINARDALKGAMHGETGSLPFIRIKLKNTYLDKVFCEAHPGTKMGDNVYLSVSDNGSGIDEAILPKLFDPFFTTKEVGQGTGLGLASSYGIIKRHGGWIGVETEQGKGSTFEIYLPRSERHAPPTARKTRDPLGMHSTETILLVDDDELVRSLGQEILEQCGYKVLLADDGEGALEIYEKERGHIAAVVLDLTMPRMSGWDVFRRLRQHNPELRVILSSGHDISGQTSEIKDLGSFKFLPKPFTPSQMEHIVQETLDQG